MRTPAGEECRYYYEDFNRGREIQRCRLIETNRRSLPWQPSDCARCEVPAILRANGSPDLRLEATIIKRFGFLRRVKVEAYCLEHIAAVDDPYRGCEQCRAELDAATLD
jgi:hypothetical protein